MNDDEIRQIEASVQPGVIFTRFWTMKESYYKLTGDDNGGNTARLLDNASHYRFNTVIFPRYLYTTCQA